MKSGISPQSALRAALKGLMHDPLLSLLLVTLILLSALNPEKIAQYPVLVDWPTMATLTGLLILTKALEISGSLNWIGTHLLARVRSERSLALFLVGLTAALATVLTNDVALFVAVPLTLTLYHPEQSGNDATQLPITRLIIFEALAANAGSILTPIGNPQNMYLWHQSNVSFSRFTLAMLPLALIVLVALLVLTACMFSSRSCKLPGKNSNTIDKKVDRTLLTIGVVLYPLFLILTDMQYAPIAVLGVVVIFLFLNRQVLMQIDWLLLLIFALMFIDLRLIAASQPVQDFFASADLSQQIRLYGAAIAASQVISNVPATILLHQFSTDWRTLAYGVNVGGAGLAIGSLANIIALRMAPQRRIWFTFHLFAIPFLIVTAAMTYGWMHWKWS